MDILDDMGVSQSSAKVFKRDVNYSFNSKKIYNLELKTAVINFFNFNSMSFNSKLLHQFKSRTWTAHTHQIRHDWRSPDSLFTSKGAIETWPNKCTSSKT